MSQAHKQHGTVVSYIIGFGLSLICTIIPYQLVVNKTLTGDRLLAAIIGFAFLQMLIQIFFFLHLGRGPKPLYNIAFFVGTVGIIAVVVGGSLFIMQHLHYNMSPSEAAKQLAEGEAIYQVEGTKTGACQGVKDNHAVTISRGSINPVRLEAKLCDTISFINQDNGVHEINFGVYPQNTNYAGQAKVTIRKGMSETITLNELGAYQFYDHVDPTLTGNFTVVPR